jgi:hypothetical protein
MKDDSKPHSRPYMVGFGKPPKDYQYKKGKSGNSKGRPKGSRNIAVLFRKGMDDKVVVTEKGKQKKITVREAIVQRALIEAMKGKDKAIERIMKIYARQFRAEEDLPGQVAKTIDGWLDSLSREELERLSAQFSSLREESLAKNKQKKEAERSIKSE